MEAIDHNFREKVLATFVVDGRLKALPVKQKKRRVILEWLVGMFEPGVRYPEKAVNEMILPHHEDFCTLRREMIELGLMKRAEGIYWIPQESWVDELVGVIAGADVDEKAFKAERLAEKYESLP
ncbi:MAG: DUF2087 domain-containing protein [Oscillospiraceae bacterium]|jgi:hypothetical protein|nr:DUF2087 domain-containing protein [Oscillospiraceae bacterium]